MTLSPASESELSSASAPVTCGLQRHGLPGQGGGGRLGFRLCRHLSGGVAAQRREFTGPASRCSSSTNGSADPDPPGRSSMVSPRGQRSCDQPADR